jgi:arylsulfatase A-like enzyme
MKSSSKRKNLILATVLLIMLILTACNSREQPKAELPNIILINADDLGYGDLGCYGATKIKTPNIDQLAKEGRRFTDAHTASAVCSPSRYGLLTGNYPLRKNFWGPIPFSAPLTIEEQTPTIASVLKKAGYHTACIGKWHLGFGNTKTNWNEELKPGPLELGFDYYFGLPLVNSGPPFVYVENRQVVGYDPEDPFVLGEESVTEKWPAKGGYKSIGGAKEAHMLYRDEAVGTTFKDKAITWMNGLEKSDDKKPFFLYLATSNIHHPFTPAPQFKNSSECGRYGDFIHELDWMVGEVLKAVDALGQKQNTLVIFTSDNGGMLNHGGQDAWRAGHKLNGDLLGFKFGAWEGGHRVPMIARWPGKIPPNTQSDQLISQIDFLTTFAEMTGQKIDSLNPNDGLNQLNSFIGNPEKMIRDHLIISPNSPDHLLVRKGQWVYIPGQNEGGFRAKNVGDHTFGGAATLTFSGYSNSDIADGKIREDAPPAQLYNLGKDLSQTNNVYNEHPEMVKELEVLLNSYRQEIGKTPKLGWIDKR